MIQSGGRLVTKTPIMPFTPATTSDWFYDYERGNRFGAYGELYRSQLWVYVLVRKRAGATARLPLKVYRRDDMNRPEADGDPYQALLANPNPAISPFRFWEWTSSTYDIYGQTFWLKRRDNGGRPYQLVPMHPSAMSFDGGSGYWCFDNGKTRVEELSTDDVVHFKSYSADSYGLSALEPLRSTLENEAAARTATSSFWRNGARPGVALVHPRTLGQDAANRLKAQWNDLAGGAGKTGSTVVLEEGMEPKVMTLSAEEAQYIETRKLNREEVCAAYDVPPPVVHILDQATFSNITEQMRSMYRDTMAPHLKAFESDMDTQLRAPDFGDRVYAEFLLDEVLRGDFEARSAAYKTADYMTIAEKRRAENLKYIEGTDEIFVNAAVVPLDEAARSRVPAAVTAQNATDPGAEQVPEGDPAPTAATRAADAAGLLQKIYLAVGKVITVEEARRIVEAATGVTLAEVDADLIFADLPPMPSPASAGPAGEPGPPQTPPPAVPPPGPAAPAGQPLGTDDVRSVMGRLPGWLKSVDDIDPAKLVKGITGDTSPVLAALALAQSEHDDVPALRARIRELTKGTNR